VVMKLNSYLLLSEFTTVVAVVTSPFKQRYTIRYEGLRKCCVGHSNS
jgi:hypothetical protein